MMSSKTPRDHETTAGQPPLFPLGLDQAEHHRPPVADRARQTDGGKQSGTSDGAAERLPTDQIAQPARDDQVPLRAGASGELPGRARGFDGPRMSSEERCRQAVVILARAAIKAAGENDAAKAI